MWLLERMRTGSGGQGPGQGLEAAPAAGEVSLSGPGGPAIVGACEHRRVPLFGPGGYRWLPREGEQALLLPLEGEPVCLGVAGETGGLEPGEVVISSGGGAEIRLKNNGEIHLNGLIVTPDGQLLGRTGGQDGHTP